MSALAAMEMGQRENVVWLRGVPEEDEQDLREYLDEVMAEWLGIDKGVLDSSVDKIYKVRSKIANIRKVPGDCLVFLNSGYFRDKNFQTNYTNKLQMEQIFFNIKEIPAGLLKKTH